MGHASIEMGPRVLRMRGDRAYAKPATSRAGRGAEPSAPHSLTTPRNATTSSSDHQARWTAHAGTEARSPSQKNGPIGKR